MLFMPLFFTLLGRSMAHECQGAADSSSAYGSRGEPALNPTELKFDDPVFSGSISSCKPTVDVYRAYYSTVSTSDLNKPGQKSCKMKSECQPVKINSLQTSSCNSLLKIRDELANVGGYTAFCRHDLSNWEMKPVEINGCVLKGTCVAPGTTPFVQRQLAPVGLRRSRETGKSLLAAGIKINALYSSPWERCKKTALQVGAAFNINEVETFPSALIESRSWIEYGRIHNVTMTKKDLSKIVGPRGRTFLQSDQWKNKTIKGNRLVISHGSNMKTIVGHAFDEGDCGWFKQSSSTYGLNRSLDVTLSSTVFKNVMNSSTKRVDLFAALSPEQIQKMAQCTSLRANIIKNPVTSESILSADTNFDLKVTENEFIQFCNVHMKDPKLWQTVLTLQARPYWRSLTVTNDFYIGEHAYWNGGWVDQAHSGGGWAFPWRKTTLDTIRSEKSEIKNILAPIDFVIKKNISVLVFKNLIKCKPDDWIIRAFNKCSKKMLSYKSIPTMEQADVVMQSTDSPDDKPIYPYNTTIEIPLVHNPMLNLAMCLVHDKHLRFDDMLKKIGCTPEYDSCNTTKDGCCSGNSNGEARLKVTQEVFLVFISVIYWMTTF